MGGLTPNLCCARCQSGSNIMDDPKGAFCGSCGPSVPVLELEDDGQIPPKSLIERRRSAPQIDLEDYLAEISAEPPAPAM